MIFPENYYQLHEIFKVDKTGQQFMVVSPSVRKADNCYSVQVRILEDDFSGVLDTDGCKVGDLTHYVGNAKPELHDCGFVKYQSKIILLCKKFFNCWKANIANQQPILLGLTTILIENNKN